MGGRNDPVLGSLRSESRVNGASSDGTSTGGTWSTHSPARLMAPVSTTDALHGAATRGVRVVGAVLGRSGGRDGCARIKVKE